MVPDFMLAIFSCMHVPSTDVWSCYAYKSLILVMSEGLVKAEFHTSII